MRAVEKWPGSDNGVGAALFAWGGAISRVPVTDTAFPHRDTRFLLSLDTSWATADRPEVVRANLNWLHTLYTESRRVRPDASYVNFTDPGLHKVKRHYDPDRFFTFPQSL